MTDLLEAVDALTKPIIEHISQTDDDGKWIGTHTVQHPPLLQQLGDAVNPSSNTDTGSSSSASARSLINGDALFEYAKISSQIADWCRIAGAERIKDPVAALRTWYVQMLTFNDRDDTFYVNMLRKWAATIRGKLDPPKRLELTVSCPVCGKREWCDDQGNGSLFPVVIEYRRPVDGEPIKPTAMCRACKTVWQGTEAVEELADEVNERHAQIA